MPQVTIRKIFSNCGSVLFEGALSLKRIISSLIFLNVAMKNNGTALFEENYAHL